VQTRTTKNIAIILKDVVTYACPSTSCELYWKTSLIAISDAFHYPVADFYDAFAILVAAKCRRVLTLTHGFYLFFLFNMLRDIS
jgi:hypothetical protein